MLFLRAAIISYTFVSHNQFKACTIPIEIMAFNRGNKLIKALKLDKTHYACIPYNLVNKRTWLISAHQLIGAYWLADQEP